MRSEGAVVSSPKDGKSRRVGIGTRGHEEKRGLVAIGKGEEVPVKTGCKQGWDGDEMGMLSARVPGNSRSTWKDDWVNGHERRT